MVNDLVDELQPGWLTAESRRVWHVLLGGLGQRPDEQALRRLYLEIADRFGRAVDDQGDKPLVWTRSAQRTNEASRAMYRLREALSCPLWHLIGQTGEAELNPRHALKAGNLSFHVPSCLGWRSRRLRRVLVHVGRTALTSGWLDQGAKAPSCRVLTRSSNTSSCSALWLFFSAFAASFLSPFAAISFSVKCFTAVARASSAAERSKRAEIKIADKLIP